MTPRIIPVFLLLSACRTPAPSTTEVINPSFIDGKLQRGIDLYAIGHEPEWSLDMDEEGDLSFTPLQGSPLKAATGSFRKTRRGRNTRYVLVRDSIRLCITLSRQPCKDNMSGHDFPMTAIVEWYGHGADNRTFHGCASRIR